MATPSLCALPLLLALTGPIESRTPEPQDTARRSAALATGVAAGVGTLGTVLTVAGIARVGALEIEELREQQTPTSCEQMDPGACWDFDIDLDLDVGTPIVATASSITHGAAIAWSAAAGHLWASHDVARGRVSPAKATGLTVGGSVALAAGVGLHVGGWFLLGDGCAQVEDGDAAIECWQRTTRAAAAMSSVGALTFDVGAGLVGYGGTMLRARPTFGPTARGASVGVRLSF